MVVVVKTRSGMDDCVCVDDDGGYGLPGSARWIARFGDFEVFP